MLLRRGRALGLRATWRDPNEHLASSFTTSFIYMHRHDGQRFFGSVVHPGDCIDTIGCHATCVVIRSSSFGCITVVTPRDRFLVEPLESLVTTSGYQQNRYEYRIRPPERILSTVYIEPVNIMTVVIENCARKDGTGH